MTIREELTGKVITVLGLMRGEDLGFTLPHEHLLIDMSIYFVEPSEASSRALARQPLSLENLSWVRHHFMGNADNLRLLDEELAIRELMFFKLSGGRTLVDETSLGAGRDPMGLARISRATGINVIMGSGYYVASAHGLEIEKKTEDQIADEIVSDIVVGVKGSGIRSGIIGEIGCSWPLRDNERKVLRAAAQAQRRTGLAINVHPNRNESGPLEAIDILREAGAQLNRVVISHMDRCGYLLETRLKMLEAGCYIEYDVFGVEGYYEARMALADEHLPDILNDIGRIKQIAELADMGYLKQILISQDICTKMQLRHWGGHGYAHILENAIPLMRVYGFTEEQIHVLTVENPRNMLTIC